MITGVLPVAGAGSRLGLAFHKALAPVWDGERLRPLYSFAEERIRRVTDDLIYVLSPEGARDPCLTGLWPRVVKEDRGELPSSIALAAKDREGLLAVALPDTIWQPVTGFVRLVNAYDPAVCGVLGLFRGSAALLDAVTVNEEGLARGIVQHGDEDYPVDGWGCFLLRAECAASFTDESSLASQLADHELLTVHLGSDYRDLGTPERYAAGFLAA